MLRTAVVSDIEKALSELGRASMFYDNPFNALQKSSAEIIDGATVELKGVQSRVLSGPPDLGPELSRVAHNALVRAKAALQTLEQFGFESHFSYYGSAVKETFKADLSDNLKETADAAKGAAKKAAEFTEGVGKGVFDILLSFLKPLKWYLLGAVVIIVVALFVLNRVKVAA